MVENEISNFACCPLMILYENELSNVLLVIDLNFNKLYHLGNQSHSDAKGAVIASINR